MNLVYDDLEANFKKIDFSSKSEIERFVLARAAQDPIFGIYHYTYNYYYNQLVKNHKHFYYVFQLDGDEVLAVVAKIRFMGTNYNRLIEFPYSIEGDLRNERAIFDLLFNNYVSQAYISDLAAARVNTDVYQFKELVDEDFYVDLTNGEIVNDRKYMKSAKLRHFLDNPRFNFREVRTEDEPHIRTLYNTWATHCKKGETGKVLYNAYLKDFKELLFHNKLIQFVILYNNIPIALSIFIPTIEGYCWGAMQWTYRVHDNFVGDNQELHRIISRSGKILHWLTLNRLRNMGFKYLSCSGGVGAIGLRQHKRETCPHVINYHKVTKR